MSIFVPDADGRRPVYGGTEQFQTDPNWKDLLLFYEYFHGDNGAGLGASHQTGWTGLVARIIQVLGYLTPEDLLSHGAAAATSSTARPDADERPGRPTPSSTSSTPRPGSTTSAGGPAGRRRWPACRTAEWDQVTPPGVDAVWLMGVWKRSPAGVRLALGSPNRWPASAPHCPTSPTPT